MMKLALLIGITLIASASAKSWQEYSPHLFPFGMENDLLQPEVADGTIDDPKPCCFPDTWQGVVRTSVAQAPKGGPATHKSSLTKVFIDGANKQVAGRIQCPFLKKDVISVVGQFNKTGGPGFTLYMFPTENPTKCWKHSWNTFSYKKTCIPDNATFLGTYKLGPLSGGMSVNSFSHSFQTCKLDWSGNFFVTDSCVPVIFMEYGKIGGCHKGKRLGEDDASDDDDGGQEEEEAGDDEVEFDKKDDEDMKTKIQKEFRLLFKGKSPDPLDKKPHPHPRPSPPHRMGSKKWVTNAYYLNVDPKISDPSVFNVPDVCKNAYSLSDATQMEDRFRAGVETLALVMEHIVV